MEQLRRSVLVLEEDKRRLASGVEALQEEVAGLRCSLSAATKEHQWLHRVGQVCHACSGGGVSCVLLIDGPQLTRCQALHRQRAGEQGCRAAGRGARQGGRRASAGRLHQAAGGESAWAGWTWTIARARERGRARGGRPVGAALAIRWWRDRRPRRAALCVCVCIDVCVYVCMYVCMHTQIQVYIYIYILSQVVA